MYKIMTRLKNLKKGEIIPKSSFKSNNSRADLKRRKEANHRFQFGGSKHLGNPKETFNNKKVWKPHAEGEINELHKEHKEE